MSAHITVSSKPPKHKKQYFHNTTKVIIQNWLYILANNIYGANKSEIALRRGGTKLIYIYQNKFTNSWKLKI